MYGLHQEQSGKVVQQDYGWVGSWGRLLVVWQHAILLMKSDRLYLPAHLEHCYVANDKITTNHDNRLQCPLIQILKQPQAQTRLM